MAASGGTANDGDGEIGNDSIHKLIEFVEYFWKSLHPELFITPLTRNPDWVNLVIEINPDHSIGAIYQPGDI
jgi:pantothenate kinase-related protein Tda10